jgi:hypothetical protein
MHIPSYILNDINAGIKMMANTIRSITIIGARSFVAASSPKRFAVSFLSSKASVASLVSSSDSPLLPFFKF